MSGASYSVVPMVGLAPLGKTRDVPIRKDGKPEHYRIGRAETVSGYRARETAQLNEIKRGTRPAFLCMLCTGRFIYGERQSIHGRAALMETRGLQNQRAGIKPCPVLLKISVALVYNRPLMLDKNRNI